MEGMINIMFEFGYAVFFGILGIITLLLHTPKEEGIESYKKSRITLGIALIIIAVYSVIRLLTIQNHDDYADFWLLVTFSLIISWLTYASVLFLMETPRYLTRHFIIDGLAPTSLILISGIVCTFFTSIHKAAMIFFGCIFGVKCIWMFYTCLREYRKCENELDNYYDQSPDIRWIRNVIYIALLVSALAMLSFYFAEIHLFFYLLLPIVYATLTFRVINFMPKKIDAIRRKNLLMDHKPEEEKKEKIKDLSEKIAPKIEAWVKEKGFCKPDITIKDVAMDMGTNHNYLSSYLNKHLNITFQVWLNTLRIEESKIILTSGEKISIEEVGIRVGIPQSYNFSRWFRVVTDTTPYQYRKMHRS